MADGRYSTSGSDLVAEVSSRAESMLGKHLKGTSVGTSEVLVGLRWTEVFVQAATRVARFCFFLVLIRV